VLKEQMQYEYMPALSQIESDLTQRSNSDIMNTYYIDLVARSFTDIEDKLYAKFENQEALRQEKTLKEVDLLSPMWTG
jgi:hypothetical protein